MRHLCFIMLALLFLTAARSPDEMRALLGDRERMNAEMFINPTQLAIDAEEFLPHIDSAKDPQVFLNTMLLLSGFVESPNNPEFNKKIEIAREMAAREKDLVLSLDIRIRDARLRKTNVNAEIEQLYKESIAEAERLGRKEDEALFKTELANRLSDWGQLVPALKYVQEAMELAKDPAVNKRMVVLTIKIQAVMLFQDMDMKEEAIVVLHELVAACREHGLTYMEGAQLHNLGGAQMAVPAHLKEADATLKEAMRVAEKIPDSYLINNVRVKQAELLHRLKRSDEALSMILKTAPIFVELKNPVREADAYKRAAAFAAALKRWPETIAYAQRAEAFFKADYPDDNEEIQKVLYEAHKALGHTAEALDHMEQWAQQKVATDKKKEEIEFNKISVKFGLDTEREKSLRLERERSDEHRRRLYTSAVLVLTFGLLILAIAAFSQSRRVAASRSRYQEVMEAIDEGILRIDHRLQIESGYSPYLKNLFRVEADLTGVHFLEFINSKTLVDTDAMAILKATLGASFGEEPLVWQMNEAHLPHELQTREKPTRTLSVHWTPVFDRRDHLQRVVVTLRDKTNQLRLEQILVQEKARLDAIPAKLGEVSKAGLGHSQQIFKEAFELLQVHPEGLSGQALIDWRRHLHTLKGNARTLGLRSFSGYIHQLEGALGHDEEFAECWARLQLELQEYHKLLTGILIDSEARENSLAGLLSPMLPDFRQRIETAQLPFADICIQDGVLHWVPEKTALVKAILTHALQNSLDHGYLRPRSKGWQATPFRWEVRADQRGEELKLEMRDWGAGIDFTTLRSKAQARGQSDLRDAALIPLLFEDGISTAESITDTSGRGIGLAAIRGLCQEHQGQVTLMPQADAGGVVLSLTLPYFFKALVEPKYPAFKISV